MSCRIEQIKWFDSKLASTAKKLHVNRFRVAAVETKISSDERGKEELEQPGGLLYPKISNPFFLNQGTSKTDPHLKMQNLDYLILFVILEKAAYTIRKFLQLELGFRFLLFMIALRLFR